ncbi:hypothetical protein ACS2BX_25695 [Bacillus cereus group sp. BceL300]|uniref:hypothetical protein n=1 Tax=Bacillus cereus group TaxID=86661 RepID=UPI0014439233|nr:hypothetical protein [Bacillus cereus]MDK7480957.1 hypothetical protein [Bacillus cereus]NKW77377.1 hypothetical protein [Bacillus cereus]NKX14794.1 hypothetical protein [Bacillus cereus]
MELKKLQMQINAAKAPGAYQLVKRWEEEGGGEKGYEAKKIQDVLSAWSNLSEMYGTNDIMKLAMMLAQGKSAPAAQVTAVEPTSTEETYVEEETEKVEEVDPNEGDYLAIIAGAKKRAEEQREKSDSH